MLSDLQAGNAGEHLVCADLILKGYCAFLANKGACYDVILEAGGILYKVQVKTTREPMRVPQRKSIIKKYCFNVRRCGKGGRRSYADGEVDIFALVALDSRTIGYIDAKNAKQTMFFCTDPVDSGNCAKPNGIKTLSSYPLDLWNFDKQEEKQ